MNTGPSRATRQLVAKRAHHVCEMCGLVISAGPHIHHRSPRRMGGSADPDINSPSNLMHLCFTCHGFVERNRYGGYVYGWLCRQGTNPAQQPVLILGNWYFLTVNGEYRDAPDPTEDHDA